jgi:hypothetical protein
MSDAISAARLEECKLLIGFPVAIAAGSKGSAAQALQNLLRGQAVEPGYGLPLARTSREASLQGHTVTRFDNSTTQQVLKSLGCATPGSSPNDGLESCQKLSQSSRQAAAVALVTRCASHLYQELWQSDAQP